MNRIWLLLIMVVLCNTLSAQIVVFNPVNDKSGSNDSEKQIITKAYKDIDDEITIRMNWVTGTSSNDPALNSDKGVYKFYIGGTLTISAKNRNILGIVLVRSTAGGNYFSEVKVLNGDGKVSLSSDKKEVVWSGNSKEIQLKNNSSVVWLSEIRIIVDAFYISESKCSTLYLPYSFKMPQNVTGHTMIVDKGEIKRMNVYNPGDAVPKETPLLIEGPAGTYVCESLSNNLSSPVYNDNNLIGSDGKEIKNSGFEGVFYYYKLSYKSNEERILGFYWGTEGGKSITVPAGKCCLKVSQANAFPEGTSSAAKGFSLDNIINNVVEITDDSQHYNDKIYNINGVYVGEDKQNLAKGTYIQNGKKVIIK